VSRPALPAGYVTGRERDAVVVALPSVLGRALACIAQSGSLYEHAAAQPDAQSFTGRGAAFRLRMPDGDWVVRHYRRGGAIARLLDDRYLRIGRPRPLRELHASVLARSRGVDSPEVLVAAVHPAAAHYRADIATRYIDGSRDLAEHVLGAARAGPAERLAAWRAAGALLRSAFDAGVEHADLNLRNILIAGAAAAPRALLLDLDRAVVCDHAVSDSARAAMLDRLHRSRHKLEALLGSTTSAAELAALETGLRS
jgi:3-deoxy-D-manno-octulosonic acid kinase